MVLKMIMLMMMMMTLEVCINNFSHCNAFGLHHFFLGGGSLNSHPLMRD